ncbi:delta-hemolysin, partial [Staphylococcus warneri]
MAADIISTIGDLVKLIINT